MPVTVRDIVTRVLAATDTGADAPLGFPMVASWVSDRYRQLASRVRFRHRRQLGTIALAARIDGGTATITEGSTAVALDATAQAAIGSAGIAGRYIRFDTVWYEIASYAAPTITLNDAIAGRSSSTLTGTVSTTDGSDVVTGVGTLFTSELQVGDTVEIGVERKTVSAITNDTEFTADSNYSVTNSAVAAYLFTYHDQTYVIVQRYYELAADAQWLGKFVHMRRRREIVNRAIAVLDLGAPERNEIANGPQQWAEVGRGSNDRIRVEFYPYNENSELIHYVYWNKPAALDLTSTVPDGIPEYVLMEGVLINLYRYRASQAEKQNRVDVMQVWLNEARRQATSWERHIQEAVKADLPVDDISFLLHATGMPTAISATIRTANDEIWNRASP